VPPPEDFLAFVTDPAAVTAAQVSEATNRVLEEPPIVRRPGASPRRLPKHPFPTQWSYGSHPSQERPRGSAECGSTIRRPVDVAGADRVPPHKPSAGSCGARSAR
jgi:hypothetical protein